MENKQSLLYLIPKKTYYNSKEEVIKEGFYLHNDLFKKDRELYTYLLYFVNSTYYSKSLIIEKLLSNSVYKNKDILINDPIRPEIENKLILHALYNESITHALKMLLRLKKERVNNTRTTKLILEFLFKRGNLDFIAVKYKNKIKSLLTHALGLSTINEILNRTEKGMKKYNKFIKIYNNPYDLEVFDFVFGKEREFKSKYLNEYIRVRNLFASKKHLNYSDISTFLPFEVLLGFNNFYKRYFPITVLISNSNLSDKQKIQLSNTVKRHSNNTLELIIDFEKYSIVELYKYIYNKENITEKEIKECLKVIDKKAEKIRRNIENNFVMDLENTVIILDYSHSNFGSTQTKMHPFYKNLALAKILGTKNNVISVGGKKDKLGRIIPSGDTNLSKGLLETVKKGYKNILVLSDGFENVCNFDKVYKQLKKIGYDLNVIHFNPVFSPKNFSFKAISDEVVTIPYTNEKDIENLMFFYLLNTDTEKFKKFIREKIEKELLK